MEGRVCVKNLNLQVDFY